MTLKKPALRDFTAKMVKPAQKVAKRVKYTFNLSKDIEQGIKGCSSGHRPEAVKDLEIYFITS
jgi:hypothetical protein